MPEIDAGVLIGGKSIRFGQAKATLKFGDITLLERIYRVLKNVLSTIWIIGHVHKSFELPTEIFVKDIISNAGPMGGLYTVLHKSQNPLLLTSCDTPFIMEEHVQYLINQYDPLMSGTIAVSDKGVEPLFGIYQPKILPLIEKLIATDTLALHRIFDYKKVKFVDFSKAGYISDLFFNINTLSDYKKALYLREEFEKKNRLKSPGGKNG
jgi:molybdopterin-guanine dinucleotide biosynthesis protein A